MAGRPTVVSGSADHTLKLWNVVTGRLLRTLAGHSNSVESVETSPDSRTVVSGSRDNSDSSYETWPAAERCARRWDMPRNPEGTCTAPSLWAFSLDGRTIASGTLTTGVTDRVQNVSKRPEESRRIARTPVDVRGPLILRIKRLSPEVARHHPPR